ncbi:phosphoenolpyruvate synthase [Clostridium sp. PL3]|uniref:Phosphoenolpyruvate synthase n=1 Tax=Clostridium thailandense TaxID=2794346 RepID=A0A949WXG6_9CLOT|nr:PEP/pyruvate-binding domain-containing protein [Clostridium thailandense]MBV7275932.1 phosphoenolpyruvate synthase [Clostridium thailandense]
MKFAYNFSDITNEALGYAGGKGSALCRMYNAGIDVPNGFVILAEAFENNELKKEAHLEIKKCLEMLTEHTFAVRSSALSEDSAKTSFAGEFESVLDVARADVFSAIEKVAASAKSERVSEYSKIHGIDDEHKIAVVVQSMINAKMAGVLFSADPITGSHVNMVGNFVFGAGEQLVSGEKNAYPFTISRIDRKYNGDKELAAYAKILYKAALKAEKIFGCMLDIEWVVDGGKLYIVQARPITTLQTIDYDTYEINQSLDTDALWSSNNVGEAVPDVMSPFTWSLLHEMDLECQKVPGYFMFGNICGRTYSNISVMISSLRVLGYNVEKSKELISDVFGNIPKNIEVPIYPFGRVYLIKEMLQRSKKSIKRMRDSKKQKAYYLENTPVWYVETLERIEAANNREELLGLWTSDVRPFLSVLWNIWFGGAGSATLATLRKKLAKMAGEELANLLCSNFSGEQSLVSMKPLLAIEQVISGSLTPEKYLELYGHRSPHEFEVYYEYPADDPFYIEKQIKEFKNANLNATGLMKKQQSEFMKGKELFLQKFPGKEEWLEKKLEKVSKDAHTRESLRNEFVKVFRVMRHLLLKIGSVTGIGEDIFMMYCFEVPKFLQGDTEMLVKLPIRRKNFEEYQKLPVFPQLIRGRFNPKEWVNSKDRRQDYYDPNAETPVKDENVIKGFAGAPGTVEGRVRILHSFEEAEDFQKGEILVTTMTNIGWTPLFPKAAAIITDLGAPLSHAAIVARELGIPAVVGCGIATTELKTGDFIIVNGSTGIVRKRS